MKHVLLCFVVLMAGVSGAAADRRVALVIGNADYVSAGSLDNPKNDADAVAAALEKLDFEVLKGIDLDHRGMQSVIRDFSELLVGSDVALFYYAGHGIQVSGQNYLIPVDAELEDETDLEFSAVDFDLIIRQMEREPRVKLLFLDACRDNPFKQDLARGMTRARATGRVYDGLAEISVNRGSGGGTFIAFATDPGALAMDSDGGKHSPFTQALLDHIERPGLEVHAMMIDVRSTVWQRTSKRQRPWSNSSLTGKFYFRSEVAADDAVVLAMADSSEPVVVEPPQAGATPETEVEDQGAAPPSLDAAGEAVEVEIEMELWRAAAAGNTALEYQAYLEAYPRGRFAAIAKARIANLTKETIETPAGPSPSAGSPAGQPVTPAPAAGSVATQAQLPTPASPEAQEAALNLDRSARRELQRRLRLAGFDPGAADGILGPRSRAALSAWQEERDYEPSGYLDGKQWAELQEETKVAYAALMDQLATRQSRPAQARTQARAAPAPRAEPETREGSHLGRAFRKIGHGIRDIFR